MATRKSELVFTLSGRGISPETVDTVRFLGLAQAYFALVVETAHAAGLELTLRGVRVRSGSAALAAVPNSMPAAAEAATRTVRVLKGQESASSGTVELANQVGRLVRALPDTQTPRVVAGRVRYRIEAPMEIRVAGPWETSELRVQPLRVGGMQPSALFGSPAEHPFSLRVTEEQARQLGALLYLPVDIEARFCRDSLGRIEQGQVSKIHKVDDGSPIEAWQAWFSKNAAWWDEVKDIDAAIGRGLH